MFCRWNISKWLYIWNFSYTIVTMFSSYRNVYGDLASLIIFLLWIYFAWTICLAGAHWTYLLQTASQKRMVDVYKSASMAYHRTMMRAIVERIIAIHPTTLTFEREAMMLNLSEELGLPAHVSEDLINGMTDRKILLSDDGDTYTLSATYASLNPEALLQALDKAGGDEAAAELFKKVH